MIHDTALSKAFFDNLFFTFLSTFFQDFPPKELYQFLRRMGLTLELFSVIID